MKAAIVGIAGPFLGPDEAALFRAAPPAGIILFARNITSPDQLAALVAELRATLPPGGMLLVDQEGGRVARLRPPYWLAHPPAATLGTLHATDPLAGQRAAWLTGALIGLDCRQAGFDVACAPVLDLRHPGAHDVIGDRSFGAEPGAVATLAGALAAGLLAAGILPVAKHVPGHGRALADSHLSLPTVAADRDALAADIAPFRVLAGLPWMMTAHVCYVAWDATAPATLSHTILRDVVRGCIGFDGVLVSDDLAMHALKGAPGALAVAALSAGCDLALHCTGEMKDNEDLLTTCPALTVDAIRRLAAGRAQLPATKLVTAQRAALLAERGALLEAAR
jgi:beta-N-acetylhexosaminidase